MLPNRICVPRTTVGAPLGTCQQPSNPARTSTHASSSSSMWKLFDVDAISWKLFDDLRAPSSRVNRPMRCRMPGIATISRTTKPTFFSETIASDIGGLGGRRRGKTGQAIPAAISGAAFTELAVSRSMLGSLVAAHMRNTSAPTGSIGGWSPRNGAINSVLAEETATGGTAMTSSRTAASALSASLALIAAWIASTGSLSAFAAPQVWGAAVASAALVLAVTVGISAIRGGPLFKAAAVSAATAAAVAVGGAAAGASALQHPLLFALGAFVFSGAMAGKLVDGVSDAREGARGGRARSLDTVWVAAAFAMAVASGAVAGSAMLSGIAATGRNIGVPECGVLIGCVVAVANLCGAILEVPASRFSKHSLSHVKDSAVLNVVIGALGMACFL